MVPQPDLSVVLPVHAGVRPEHLWRTVESIDRQTLRADEVVLVEDGPLTAELRGVVDGAQDLLPLRKVVLSTNGGAGIANQAGLEAAAGVWIAKVDADDVNLPHRFETQRAAVDQHHLDLCGAAMLEFVDEEANVVSVRRNPTSHEAIGRRLRSNNPINHPTAFYRRSVALGVGGYPDWRFMQDYGFFARMLAADARAMNLREPLTLFRAGPEVTQRRRSVEIRRTEVILQRELRDLGLVSIPRMVTNLAWRSAYRLLPTASVDLVSRRMLARPVSDAEGDTW